MKQTDLSAPLQTMYLGGYPFRQKLKLMFGVIWGMCLSLAAIPLHAQDQYSYRGFDAPVSVSLYGGYFYLSNAGNASDMTAKDGTGYISRVKSDGTQEEVTMKYITGLDGPKGILTIQGVLYVCDVDRLIGIELKNRKKVFEMSFAEENTLQLTDIVSLNEKVVYVSATDINTIFEVDLSSKKYGKWADVTAPSGLLINKDQMYVCSWGTDSLPNGKVGVINMKNKKYTQLTDVEGYLWGLALNGSKLYYSDWVGFGKRGVIRWIDLDTKEDGQVKMTSRMGGPADFHYDARNNVFIVPAILEGVVYGAMGFK
jgi:DNA-binding beta-propeller fold protein YncE